MSFSLLVSQRMFDLAEGKRAACSAVPPTGTATPHQLRVELPGFPLLLDQVFQDSDTRCRKLAQNGLARGLHVMSAQGPDDAGVSDLH